MSPKDVQCVCGGTKRRGTFTVDGAYLVLKTGFGETRVLVGLQEPRRLATKLMKNVCNKALRPAALPFGQTKHEGRKSSPRQSPT